MSFQYDANIFRERILDTVQKFTTVLETVSSTTTAHNTIE